eukprot:XP_001693426.1 predicted protein [Chlamydomonas reinhardtii]
MTDAEAAELEKEEHSLTTLVGGLELDQLDEKTVKSALYKLALQEAAMKVQKAMSELRKARIEAEAAAEKAKTEKAAVEKAVAEEKAKSEARMAKIKEEAAADMGKCGLGLLLASVAVACSLHGCTCQRMHEGMSSGACVCAMR